MTVTWALAEDVTVWSKIQFLDTPFGNFCTFCIGFF